jgi:glycosyltransferase involved in cell wall biosynthesis
MKITIIAPALPPLLDGIGDYSAAVATELSRRNEVEILTATPNPTPLHNTTIRTVFDVKEIGSIRGIVPAVVQSAPDWVLVQYNPFAYGRYGWNPYLVPALRAIRRKLPKTRIAVMAHESFVPPLNAKFAVMAAYQRLNFYQLGQTADILLLSIEPWAEKFARWFPRIPVRHLPIGSNIPRVKISRDEARLRLGITKDQFVIGLFGTSHQSRPMDWIGLAGKRLREIDNRVLLLYVGPNVDDIRTAVGDALPIQCDGPAAADEVSRRFAAMDLNLCPFLDGVSTRRGTFMTSIQHGLPTVSTQAFNTDRELAAANGDAWVLSDNDPASFVAAVEAVYRDSAKRARLGVEGQRIYDSKFAWGPVCDRMIAYLAETAPR